MGWRWRWVYTLEYKHLLGHTASVKLGETKCEGGPNPTQLKGRWKGWKPHEPFRDSAHIRHEMDHLKLPAFLVWDAAVVVEAVKAVRHNAELTSGTGNAQPTKD